MELDVLLKELDENFSFLPGRYNRPDVLSLVNLMPQTELNMQRFYDCIVHFASKKFIFLF